MSEADEKELSFKFVLVGDSGVGKTAIVKRFCEGSFNDKMPHTIGLEFATRSVEISGTPVILQMWDTAGQEKFRSITRSYFRSSSAVFMVFDLTSRESFASLPRWLSDVQSTACPEVVLVLVGNKADLAGLREVTQEEAKEFAKQHNLLYFETSARTGDGVQAAFRACLDSIERLMDSGAYDGTVKAGSFVLGDDGPPPDDSAKCC
jgi:small GTP-binding protein